MVLEKDFQNFRLQTVVGEAHLVAEADPAVDDLSRELRGVALVEVRQAHLRRRGRGARVAHF